MLRISDGSNLWTVMITCDGLGVSVSAYVNLDRSQAHLVPLSERCVQTTDSDGQCRMDIGMRSVLALHDVSVDMAKVDELIEDTLRIVFGVLDRDGKNGNSPYFYQGE